MAAFTEIGTDVHVTGAVRPPSGLISHKIVCDQSNNGLYLVGGWKNGKFCEESFVREVWKLNFSTRKWSQLKSEHPPSTLTNHTLAKLDSKKLLVYGGSLLGRGDALGNNNETFIYDTEQQLWTKLLTSGQACPTPSKYWFGQAMRLDGNRLYAVTGRRQVDGAKLLVHCLDINTLQWTYLSTPSTEPAGRVRHEILISAGKVYVFGGAPCSFDHSFSLDKITCFDPASGLWHTVTAIPDAKEGFPGARTCHTLVPYDGGAFLCGGYCIDNDGSDTSQCFDDLWRFDPATFKWTKLPVVMPRPLWSHAADVTSDGWMYVYGGCTRSNKKHRSDAMYKICLTLPKLESLAWSRVTSSLLRSRDLMDTDYDHLDLGSYFVNKLSW